MADIEERLRRTEKQHRVTMLGHVYIDVPVNPDGPEAADTIALMRKALEEADFLCARLRDLEGFDGDELLRQLMGHVLPPLARLEMQLAALDTSKESDSGD